MGSGIPTDFPSSSNYSIKILDKNGRVLFDRFLGGVIFEVYVTTDKGPMLLEREFSPLLLKLPLIEDASTIEIYHKDKKIFLFEIAWCNRDGACDSLLYENYENCPLDCHCGNGVCEENLEENYENCPQDCKIKPPSFSIYIYFVVVAIILALIFIIVWKSRRASYESPA